MPVHDIQDFENEIFLLFVHRLGAKLFEKANCSGLGPPLIFVSPQCSDEFEERGSPFNERPQCGARVLHTLVHLDAVPAKAS